MSLFTWLRARKRLRLERDIAYHVEAADVILKVINKASEVNSYYVDRLIEHRAMVMALRVDLASMESKP